MIFFIFVCMCMYIYIYVCVCVCICLFTYSSLFYVYVYIYTHRNPVQRGPKLNGSNTKPGNWGDEAIAALRQLTSFCTRTNTLARAPVHDASLMLPHHDLCMV